jgi:tetratricopeptide (TPR) repeat protein
VLAGLRAIYFFAGDLRMVREITERTVKIAASHPDENTTFYANLARGSFGVWTGELRSSREHLEQALALDPDKFDAITAATGPPRSAMITLLSRVHWMLGYPDRALQGETRLRQMLSGPVNLFIRAEILFSIVWTRCFFLREYRMRPQADELLSISRENGFDREAAGLVLLGRILVEEGSLAAGIETMIEGITKADAVGMNLFRTQFCAMMADAYRAAGQPSEGLTAIDQAIAHAERNQDHFGEPELHRLKGELLLALNARKDEAEMALRKAIALAQHQEARSWELRAATNLAQLLRQQGRIAKARDTLGPVYNWFTEGFDTADLKDAKALLDELNG